MRDGLLEGSQMLYMHFTAWLLLRDGALSTGMSHHRLGPSVALRPPGQGSRRRQTSRAR